MTVCACVSLSFSDKIFPPYKASLSTAVMDRHKWKAEANVVCDRSPLLPPRGSHVRSLECLRAFLTFIAFTFHHPAANCLLERLETLTGERAMKKYLENVLSAPFDPTVSESGGLNLYMFRRSRAKELLDLFPWDEKMRTEIRASVLWTFPPIPIPIPDPTRAI